MAIKRYLKRARLLLILPFVVLIIGVIGFTLIEGLSILDSLYLTIVTVSTVGYGDLHPVTEGGKIFGIFLIIIGIGSFLTIVTGFTESLVRKGQERRRSQRLNMIIGVFFTEVGNKLLEYLARYDSQVETIRADFHLEQNWTEKDIVRLRRSLRQREYKIDPDLIDLEDLTDFLKEKGELLLRQIENPDLFEHSSYTELLWATVHLRDELISRKNLKKLPGNDVIHLANDATRVYGHLVGQWLDYLVHLKRHYPYLYSLAVRTNPFVEEQSVEIE